MLPDSIRMIKAPVFDQIPCKALEAARATSSCLASDCHPLPKL